MDMTTMYKVKGIGKETTITSKVNIFHEGGKITRVEDKWDGKLPDSGIANVSKTWTNAVDPRFWTNYWFGWGYSLLVLVHDSWWWMVRDFCGSFLFLLLRDGLALHPLIHSSSPSSPEHPNHEQTRYRTSQTNMFPSQAFRRLNAVSVPKMVGVPNNAEEDAKRGN
jgi:hypothetical protein